MRNKERQAYISQKWMANKRGIDFLLSFEDWKHIWETSGHFDERGRGSNKYCMARHNDQGAYAIGNVSIITNHDNISLGNRDRWRGKIVSEETKQKIKQARQKQTNVGHDKTIHICNHCQKQIHGNSNLIQHIRAKHE